MANRENNFEYYFKSETRASGEKLIAQEKMALTTKSDTLIEGFVRSTPPVRVSLKSTGLDVAVFSAFCNCPSSAPDRFCKHMWALIRLTAEHHPDFLAEKKEIARDSFADVPASSGPVPPGAPLGAPTIAPTPFSSRATDKQKAYREDAKKRAAAYRKEAYQKQKAAMNEKKRAEKAQHSGADSNSAGFHIPQPVADAVAYFKQNGFPMPDGPSREILNEAKRKLSRVFHPDRGGTHDESIELNLHCHVLETYLD